MSTTLLPLEALRTSYNRRLAPIPGPFRPIWRLALITELILHCRGQSATPQQLHTLAWASRSESNQQNFLSFLAHNDLRDITKTSG